MTVSVDDDAGRLFGNLPYQFSRFPIFFYLFVAGFARHFRLYGMRAGEEHSPQSVM
jgi:hypothetical protein